MKNIKKKQDALDNFEKAKKLENEKQFFSASFYYKDALKLFRELGLSEKQKISKKKLVEMNKKSVSEFKEVVIEQKVSNEKMKKELEALKKLLKGDLHTVLLRIGRCTSFCPKIKYIEETSNKSMPLFAMIASNATFDKKGNIIQGSHDGRYSWKMHMYNIAQDLINKLYLEKIFTMLVSSKKLNAKNLMAEFIKSEFFSDSELKIIEKGIKAYFEKDYVSALHILIPKFESMFLKLSELLGIDVISLNPGKEISTQTRTLSEIHLDSLPFKKIWGEDLCEQINFVLFRQLGYKLRHKVAHGEITYAECNFSNATLIVYFYIVLMAATKRTEKIV